MYVATCITEELVIKEEVLFSVVGVVLSEVLNKGCLVDFKFFRSVYFLKAPDLEDVERSVCYGEYGKHITWKVRNFNNLPFVLNSVHQLLDPGPILRVPNLVILSFAVFHKEKGSLCHIAMSSEVP